MIDLRIVGVNGWFVSRSLRLRSLVEEASSRWAPGKELPPWFWERRNVTLRHPGRDAEVTCILPRLWLNSIFPQQT